MQYRRTVLPLPSLVSMCLTCFTSRSALRQNYSQAVTSYLVELQSMVSQDAELAQTVAGFKALQAKFQS